MSISPELDWEEFLARQDRFLTERQCKIQMSEQERRLRTVLEMYKECTFQPRITRKAAALPSRAVEDLVDGGRSRREEWMEQQRALQQLREIEEATFRPQLLTKEAYAHVRPRINLKNPDAYLAHEAHKQRQREALRAELQSEREALELQHCTFKPQTTPLPAYLIRKLQEQHLQQLQKQSQEEQQQEPGNEWAEAGMLLQERYAYEQSLELHDSGAHRDPAENGSYAAQFETYAAEYGSFRTAAETPSFEQMGYDVASLLTQNQVQSGNDLSVTIPSPFDVPTSLITGITGVSPLPSILNSPLLESLVSASPNAQLAAMFAQLAQSTRGGQTPAFLEAFTPGTTGGWPESTRSGGASLRQLLDLQEASSLGLGEGDLDDPAMADALLKGLVPLPSARRTSVSGGGGAQGGARGYGAEGGNGTSGQMSVEQLADLGLQSPSALGVGGNGHVLYKGVHYDKEQDTWQVVVFDGLRYTVVGEYTNELEALVANELLSPAQPMQGNFNTMLAGSGGSGPAGDGDGAEGQAGSGAAAAAAADEDTEQVGHGVTGRGGGSRTPNINDYLHRLANSNPLLGSAFSPSGAALSPLFSALSPAGGGFTALLLPTPRDTSNGGGAHLLPSPSALGRIGNLLPPAPDIIKPDGTRESVYRGVVWDEAKNQWRAQIAENGGTSYTCLGFYSTQEDAARAFDAAVLRSGNKELLNFPLVPKAAQTGPKARGPRAPGTRVTSQYKGVSWNSACSKWVAVLWDRELKRARHIGSYESEEDAARAYDKEALRMLGPEAGLNFRESAADYLAEIGADGVPEGTHNSNKGSSQYRGVSWHERSQRWEVRVWGGGKQHFIGSFTEEVEAARAYDRAVLRLRGQDARSRSRMNFPLSDYNLDELGVPGDPAGFLGMAVGMRSTPEPARGRKAVKRK
ncbi:hypothetical protein GPECTOR_38g312 [Gonium pectorale]|uniref:AP2/ERF domain-containing protein n=1 Tax=Gonium pectorale TaxID=33097 RepID=A0A150GC00_GONPE|nr:hypothetical protein GPECTOR_38g312 [Gonium pectorale]|eukprot:KXZ47075.1 hypothetical protein GPECTOR_38g312 [Gonium pectorale]